MRGSMGFRYVVASLLIGSLMLPSAAAAHGSSTPADAVLGQPDLSSVGCNQGLEQPSASTLCEPSDVVMDPATGRLFVADTGNHRVLSWANTRRLTSGQRADVVLGQPDFESVDSC